MAVKKTSHRWAHALRRMPGLTMTALRHGALPVVGARALRTARREGFDDLHWKVLGDSLVRFFQQSGPMLTKLGQVLASRGDLLPEAVCVRLEALHSSQPAMARKELNRLLRKAYPEDSPFGTFEQKPLGVGSVGQVHRATLVDGSPVIVKLIRPGSRAAIERDIHTAFALTDAFFATLGRKRKSMRLIVQRALEDLETGFLSELDLVNEARSIEEFRHRLRHSSRVYVPQLYPKLSSAHLLVLEELKGQPLSSLKEKADGDPKRIKEARRAAQVALQEILAQIFDHGRFHADPHGGNLLMLEDGRLGLIDFGLTGEFTRKDRRQIARAVRALISRDADGLIEALLEFGTRPDDFDLKAFTRDLKTLLLPRKEQLKAQLKGEKVAPAGVPAKVGREGARETEGGGAEPARMDALVNELFRVAYSHRIYVPQSTTLLIKTLVTVEGVARSLDPDINLVATAVPVVLKSLTPGWLRIGSLFKSL